MKKTNKHTLLKGEGANQHTLYGQFNFDETATDFVDVEVEKQSELKHEQPNGSFGEHFTLLIDKGNWSMGKQVEYNPFENTTTQVWD